MKTKTLVVDVETNGLRATMLWCIVTYCLEEKEWRIFDVTNNEYLNEAREYLSSATHFVGHNFVKFDRHILTQFLGIPLIPVAQITDTLILSRLYNSGRVGGHSLERWGAYFHLPKVEFTDWERWDPRITFRCQRDVELTVRLLEHLRKEGKNCSELAVKTEHWFTGICDEIAQRGFPFDIDGAQREHMQLKAQLNDLQTQIRKAFPRKATNLGEVQPRLTKKGVPAANTKGFAVLGDMAPTTVLGPFSLIEWQDFNIKSPKQIVQRMNEWGWQPMEFTKPSESFPEGQPKVSVANLDTLPDTAPPEAKLIAKYLKLYTQATLFEGWIDAYNPVTGRIHGDINSIGTITHRGSHNNPNMGNITKGPHRKHWGFTSGDRRIAGVDAKGIQLRILAHLTALFTKDRTFMEQVLTGDPHLQFTLPLVGELYPQAVAHEDPSTDEGKSLKKAKDKTKRFIYAWLLGAGSLKVGTIFGLGLREGKVISETFVNKFPGLKELKAWLSGCAKKGWFPCPIGSFIPIKSDHYSLSVALQGIEQAVMKLAAVMWTKKRNKEGWDAHIIAWVHDEFQIEGHKDVIQEAGEYMAWCIAEAGRILKLRCPMEGDAPKVGMNWDETH